MLVLTHRKPRLIGGKWQEIAVVFRGRDDVLATESGDQTDDEGVMDGVSSTDSSRSDEYELTVEVGQAASVESFTMIDDEFLKVSPSVTIGPGLGLVVDILTEEPAGGVLANYIGGVVGAGSPSVGAQAIPALAVGIATTHSAVHFYDVMLSPDCSPGARCPMDEWRTR